MPYLEILKRRCKDTATRIRNHIGNKMSILERLNSFIQSPTDMDTEDNESYEYCPRCQANLTLQKGYSNKLPFWNCRGCGEMLINPEVEAEDDIAWICDKCGEMLNIQPGFSEDCGNWTCTKCGFVNKIDTSELYLSEDEYQASLQDPYKGLSDRDVLKLSAYKELGPIEGREDVILVENPKTKLKSIKKLLTTYDRSIYEYLKENPVRYMPQIEEIFEGDNCLIVIEEYIEGNTIARLLEFGLFNESHAVSVVKKVCLILDDLHNLPTPIIHRDVKPANIIIDPDGGIYLLDMNVAKWYDPKKTDDTRHMGTENFAAPEQAGYGLSASSAKSDIYAVGMLLNVMITGKFPKEERAKGALWDIIERCISLNADERYTAKELYDALENVVIGA